MKLQLCRKLSGSYKLKSRPIPLGSLRGQTYVEFIVLAVLAVVGSAAIVLFVVKPASTPPIAQVAGVVIQEDTAKSTTDAESDEKAEPLAVGDKAAPALGQPGATAPNVTDGPETNLQRSDDSLVKVDDDQADSDTAAVPTAVKPIAGNAAVKTHSLSITAVGGSVVKSTDQASYNHGDKVILEAVPNTGYSFTNWAGDLAGSSNPVTLVMESDKSVTAGFALKTYSLTVTAADGSVVKSPDQASYNHGDKVILEAVPNTGYSFTNWAGDLSGSINPATLVMESDKSVTAGFALKTYSLTATAIGGSVVKSPDQASYNHGDKVILEAVPNTGYSFTNWAGDLAGSSNPVTLVMKADRSVTAGFALKTYSLTVTATDGSVTKSPDQASYNHGDTVTLEAVPNTGYGFTNWAGDLAGSSNPATLVMNADRSVTAAFAIKGHRLTVTAVGGFVKRSPTKVSYDRGETVTLEAVPNAGYSFTNWSGDLSGVTNPATLTIDADKSVTAGFTLTAKAGDVVTNSISMKLVYVPAGSFMMGSGESAAELAGQYGKREKDFADEFPRHPVRISRGLWMGQTEVTQGQYMSIMNARPWSGKAYVQADANSPAVYVSWDDAVEFCRKLSQQEGKHYRLPTEAEWEYACRAGTTTRFSFGDTDSSLGDYAWFDGNADKVGQDYAHPGGQKKPNLWGLCDMHGNVFEWCSDFYDQKYYSNSPSVDPSGPSSGISHSLRGGSWDDAASRLRCSYRSGYRVSRGLLVGFRVVSDGQAISDIAAVPIEVESVEDRQMANEVSVTAQEETPIVSRIQEEAPVTVKTQEDTPVAVKVPTKDTAPDRNKLAVVDVAQEVTDSVAIDTDSTLIYASGNVHDILEQAAVDARSGKMDRARTALTSLLDNKDAKILAGYELGLIHYEEGDVDKAIPFFKDALTAAFPGPAFGKDEQALTAVLNQETDAARIRYELGLIYQSQSKQDQAAKLFRDALNIISAKGATYIGVKKCKSCHFKQWNSWRKTKMATAFEVLKPGVRSEKKTELKFDPDKDYTEDAACLGCHTSGFGMPGGYVVPADDDAEAQEQAADNAGVTCEGCHGPGSRSVEIQEDIKENKRPYTFAELRAVGFHKAGVRSCTSCHNASDPGKEPGYHFAYEERRKEDQHENIELKYRRE